MSLGTGGLHLGGLKLDGDLATWLVKKENQERLDRALAALAMTRGWQETCWERACRSSVNLTTMKDLSVAEILELLIEERIRLVEIIWDSIAAVPEAVTLPEEWNAELNLCLAEFEADQRRGLPGKTCAAASSRAHGETAEGLSVGGVGGWRGLRVVQGTASRPRSEFLTALEEQLAGSRTHLESMPRFFLVSTGLSCGTFPTVLSSKGGISAILAIVHTSRNQRHWAP